MPIVWTENQTLKLVILYSRHESLTNPFHRDFKNKLCRYKAYKQIVDCMNIRGLTVCDCIKRITYVKAQYCYELSKISAAISCEKMYKPKASWFPVMHKILFPFIEAYGCSDNSWKINNNERDVYKNYYSSNLNDQTAYPNIVKLRKTQSKGCSCTYANCCCAQPYKEKLRVHSKKHWDQPGTDEWISVEHEIQTDVSFFKTKCTACQTCVQDSTVIKRDLKDVYATVEDKGKRKAHDEFDMFGKSIAFQLRNINFETAVKLEKCIQDLITQERLDNIKLKHASHSVPLDCSSSNCSDCKAMGKEMICSCGLPVIMIKTDHSCEFGCK
ncbi:uncharacterized protein LOC128880343 [Hylaeus volcanicus]|uniref:uncharacterized protein LOC128880343 n=1 Tax=Hylaeus volcanicus TaxID=313075 RepID=UPI0023B7B914|nr:uncharacterized protein LOC128880343 [Hylaeus volcanicus]